jgi:hypothetical protein
MLGTVGDTYNRQFFSRATSNRTYCTYRTYRTYFSDTVRTVDIVRSSLLQNAVLSCSCVDNSQYVTTTLLLNYIEMVWGWTKSYHRRTCTYNYKDLKRDLPTTLLKTLPLECFRRFSRYCLRFMSGYREGLEGPLLDYTMKKYRSHRAIPTGLRTFLEADYKEYRDKKSTKSKNR